MRGTKSAADLRKEVVELGGIDLAIGVFACVVTCRRVPGELGERRFVVRLVSPRIGMCCAFCDQSVTNHVLGANPRLTVG